MRRKIRCYALTDKRGRFIQNQDAAISAGFKALTFKTAREAQKFIDNDSYWRGQAYVVKVAITIEGVGF